MNVPHALEGELELSDVIDIVNGDYVALIDVVVIFDIPKAILREEFLRQRQLLTTWHFGRLDDLVKNVEIAFFAVLEANSRLLQEVVDDGGRV